MNTEKILEPAPGFGAALLALLLFIRYSNGNCT
jgi:hypothetical protein